MSNKRLYTLLALLAVILIASVVAWNISTGPSKGSTSSGSEVVRDSSDGSHPFGEQPRFVAASLTVQESKGEGSPPAFDEALLVRIFWKSRYGSNIEGHPLTPTKSSEGEIQYVLNAKVPPHAGVVGLFVSDPRVCPFGAALRTYESSDLAEANVSSHTLVPLQILRLSGKTEFGGTVDDFRVRASIKEATGGSAVSKTIVGLEKTLQEVPDYPSSSELRRELRQARHFLSSSAGEGLFLSETGLVSIAVPSKAIITGVAISSGFQAATIEAFVMPARDHAVDVVFEKGLTITAHVTGGDGKPRAGATVSCYIGTATLVAETDVRGIAILPIIESSSAAETCDVGGRWGEESAIKRRVSLGESQEVHLSLTAPIKFYGVVRNTTNDEVLAGVKLRVMSATTNLFAEQVVSGLDGRIEVAVPQAVEKIFFWVVGRYGPRQAYRPEQYFENESLRIIKNRMYAKGEFGTKQAPQRIELVLDKDVNTATTGSLKVSWQTRRGERDSIQIIAWYAPWNESLQAFTPEQPVDFTLKSSDPSIELPAGKYRIEGTTDHTSSKIQRSPFREVTILPNNETNINLTLEPLGTRRLLLLNDQGQPLVETEFYLDGMPRNGRSAKTNAHGIAVLQGIALGQHTISLAHSPYWSSSTNDLGIDFGLEGEELITVRCLPAKPQIVVLFDQETERPSSFELQFIDGGWGFPHSPLTPEKDRIEYFGLGHGKWYLFGKDLAGQWIAAPAHITITDFETQHIYRWMGRGIGPDKGFQKVE